MIFWYIIKLRFVYVFIENVSFNNRLGSFILDMFFLIINWINFIFLIIFCFLLDMVLIF